MPLGVKDVERVAVADRQAEFAGTYGTDAGFASVFQLKPVVGRLVTPDEFKAKTPVAVVSETFAIRHFGGAAGAL